MIEMSVSDTGIGMSEQEISRLFKRFSQASSEIEKRFGGSGLGLSICAHFCALMGGKIGVTSEVGKGSRFTVSIPSRLLPKGCANAGDAASPSHGFAFAN
jgi:signal transduction histidine kinase